MKLISLFIALVFALSVLSVSAATTTHHRKSTRHKSNHSQRAKHTSHSKTTHSHSGKTHKTK